MDSLRSDPRCGELVRTIGLLCAVVDGLNYYRRADHPGSNVTASASLSTLLDPLMLPRNKWRVNWWAAEAGREGTHASILSIPLEGKVGIFRVVAVEKV